MGNYKKAIEYLKKALEIKGRYGNQRYIGTSMLNLGDTYRKAGNYEEAYRYLKEGLRKVRLAGDTYLEAVGYEYLGWYYEDRKEYEKAREYFKRAYELFNIAGAKKKAEEVLAELKKIEKKVGAFAKREKREEKEFERRGERVTSVQGGGNCVNPDYRRYFFGVVVYDYYEISDLDYVRNDKDLIYKLATCYMGVPEKNLLILENPSFALLKSKLKKFVKGIGKKDAILYFYYSGHGITDSKGRFYILPADALIESEDLLKESGMDVEQLKRILAGAKGKKIAFIDACRINPRWKPAVILYKPNLRSLAIIFSTKEGQTSNSDKEGQYSAFTRALYEMASSGLLNLDFDSDGYIEIKELKKPLINWVRRLSSDDRQTPDFWGPKDFEIFPVE